MSENLDLVRSIYADWERGDFSRTGWAHPEIEFELFGGPEPTDSKSAPGGGAWARSWLSASEDFPLVVDECREIDDERVLVLVGGSGRGKRSGVEIGRVLTKAAALIHVRDGKVTKFFAYWDRDHALADLGLKE